MHRLTPLAAAALALAAAACQRPQAAAAAATPVAVIAVDAVAAASDPPLADAAHDGRADEGIAALVGPQDTVLARKAFDLLGDGASQTVLIVRRGGAQASLTYPCVLLVLRNDTGTYRVAASSDKVVDCVFNELARRATDLSEHLELGPGHLSYVNQGAKSNTTYTFKYSAGKSDWYLAQAQSHYSVPSVSGGGLDSFSESAAHPGDLPWMSLTGFDPDVVEAAMRKNKTLLK